MEQLDELVVGEVGVVDVLEVLDDVRALAGEALVDQRLEELGQRRARRRHDHDRVPRRVLLDLGHRLGAERAGRLEEHARRRRRRPAVVNWFVRSGAVGSWNCWLDDLDVGALDRRVEPVDVGLAEVVVERDRSDRRGVRVLAPAATTPTGRPPTQ